MKRLLLVFTSKSEQEALILAIHPDATQVTFKFWLTEVSDGTTGINNERLAEHAAGCDAIILVGDQLATWWYDRKVLAKRLVGIRYTFQTETWEWPLRISYSPLGDGSIFEYIAHIMNDALHGSAESVKKRKTISTLTDLKGETGHTFAFDLETNMLSPFRVDAEILSMAASSCPHQAAVIPKAKVFDMGRELLHQMSDKGATVIGHQVKFDLLWLISELDADPDVLDDIQIFDTLPAVTLLDENSPDNSLKAQAFFRCGIPRWDENINRKKMDKLSEEVLHRYNMDDADASIQLALKVSKVLEEKGLMPVFDYLMDVEKELIRMELKGMKVDEARMNKVRHILTDRLALLERVMFALTKVHNLSLKSSQQIADVLYNMLKCPRLKGNSTADPVLRGLLQDPDISYKARLFINLLRKHRKISKLMSTYVLPLPEYIRFDGRVHTFYHLGKNEHGTRTWRLSSSDPNQQNAPKRSAIRSMFIPDEGYGFVDADYKQIELRIGAMLANETSLLEAFSKGLDPHTMTLANTFELKYDDVLAWLKEGGNGRTAEWWNGQRRIIKVLNFGIFYGMGRDKVKQTALQLGIILTDAEADRIIRMWMAAVPNIVKFIKETKEYAVGNQEVTNFFGITRHLPGASFKGWYGAEKLRQAVNYQVQSVAGLICEFALIEVGSAIRDHGFDASIVAQTHDDILNQVLDEEIDEFVPILKQAMEYDTILSIDRRLGKRITVPLEVDIKISKRWL